MKTLSAGQKSSSIFNNPWDAKPSKIIIDITNQKEILPCDDRLGFVFLTNILIEGKSISLMQFTYKIFPNTILSLSPSTHYEVVFNYSYLNESKQIKLPKDMEQNLLCFLSGSRRKNENCKDFINDLYFKCNTQPIYDIYFSFAQTTIEDVTIGQAIAIGTHLNNQFRANHFAIYLGGDLYLSVLGVNNFLGVTTLEQLKVFYNDNVVRVINPFQYSDSINFTYITSTVSI